MMTSSKNISQTERSRPLILGLGNSLMGDEGIGCHAVQFLLKQDYSQVADIIDGGTGGFLLMEHMVSHDVVILIDATLDNYPEGTIRVIQPNSWSDLPPHLSTHEIGLKDLIASLTLLDKLPELYLITVSVKKYSDLSTELSSVISDTLPIIQEKLDEIIAHLQKRNN